MKAIKVGSDFSGVGAFDQALNRIGILHEHIFACDWDKYARITYAHNYGDPKYFPKDVYEREIPKESLDIYMTSPPCQAFSIAGKRQGKNDSKGILFFNSHEFIQVNKPRFFIFENVKGLLSDDNGNTFQEWVNILGGKSVNGLPILFPYENSVPYHLYWQVLNSKKHGVPQNRERVFLVGIRDDQDNSFQFPKEEYLTVRLKDVLANEVDKKYFLSDKMVLALINHQQFNKFNPTQGESESSCITSRVHKMGNADNYIKIVVNTNPSGNGMNENMFDSDGISPTLTKNNGEDRKTWIADYRADEGLRIRKDNISPCMTSSMRDTLEWKPNQGTRNPPLVGDDYKIRRLTPRECFRLQDFPDTFDFSCVSDSQAYKQAGNSITVRVLEKIIRQLKL